MRYLLIGPVVVIMMLTLVPQLLAVAENVQNKAVSFADDMNMAIDCATRGIDITVCSPNLMDHDFEPEIQETVELATEIYKYSDLEPGNYTIEVTGEQVIVTFH